jgi:monoterpene epsilon-lactone hydrolase
LAAHLAAACGCSLLSVHYRLSPEHKFPAAINDCITAYKYLLTDLRYQADKIIVSGDSCGGGLSTIVPLALIGRGLPVPAASVALSPWYDLENTDGGTMDSNAENDVLSTKPFVRKLTGYYVDGNTVGAMRSDSLISPLLASDEELAKVPPHWISVGGYDTLRDHGERMAARLQGLGVEAILEIHEGQQHVMEFMAGKAPEAIKSLEDIGKWVKIKIGALSRSVVGLCACTID